MEQRDFMLNQIEQLGKVLAKILSDFIEFKSEGEVTQGIGITNQRLQSDLGIDIEELTVLNKEELKNYLENRQLTAEHLEVLSEYMKEIGEEEIHENKKEAKRKLEKAIELLDIADQISNTISFDRINKRKEIENILPQLF